MSLHGKKLGLLLSTRPEAAGFQQGMKVAEAALRQGVDVYVYCIDDALYGLDHPGLQTLKASGKGRIRNAVVLYTLYPHISIF